MHFVLELWQPILLSGAVVFIASAIAWTVLPFHNKEFKALSTGDDVREAVKRANAAPGLYMFPANQELADRRTPEAMARWAEGPSGWMTIIRPGPMSMGAMMTKSVVFYTVVAFLAAYVAHHALPNGASYLKVFQIVGTVGFMTYCAALVPESIWFGRPWKSFVVNAAEALVYGLLMGGVFGWLWPK